MLVGLFVLMYFIEKLGCHNQRGKTLYLDDPSVLMFNALEFARQKFPSLNAKEVTQIVTNTKLKKLKAGEVFIEAGTVAEGPAYIAKGLMRSYVDRDGEEKTVVFRKESEFIGSLPSMFRDKPAIETTVAVEDSVIMMLDWVGFRALAGKNAVIGRAYSRLIEDMMLEAVERIQDFTVLTPEERYTKFENDNRNLMQRIPLKYLASYLGVAAPSLSRIRLRLSQKGN